MTVMVIDEYLAKWNLSALVEIAQTTTSDVYLVSHQGKRAVLKVLTPIGRSDEASGEIALRTYGGNGAVRLLAADPGAHLLAFVDGRDLKSVVSEGRDAEATEIICGVLSKLHSCPGIPGTLKSLSQHFGSLFSRASETNADLLIIEATECARLLLKNEDHRVVLHGDIHHKNIIHSSVDGWLAIDPKGLWGERTYDFANVFYNPDDMPTLLENSDRILRTAEAFSRSSRIDSKRILRFAFAFGCLSASWCIEDGHDPRPRLQIATRIRALL